MTHELSRIVAASSVLAVALLTTGLAAVSFRRLRRLHPQAWLDLGEPSLMRNSRRFTRFIWGASHRALNDPTLNRLVIALRGLSILGFIAFLVLVASMMR
jgi:hypothetical protein